jgi:hypothetical protein
MKKTKQITEGKKKEPEWGGRKRMRGKSKERKTGSMEEREKS